MPARAPEAGTDDAEARPTLTQFLTESQEILYQFSSQRRQKPSSLEPTIGSVLADGKKKRSFSTRERERWRFVRPLDR